MIPLFETAFNKAIESGQTLNNQARGLMQDKMFEELIAIELISEIECTPEGMLLHPMKDPMGIVTYFEVHHKIRFSREKNENDTYDWVTVLPGDRGFVLRIIAGEVFDMTGTVVTPNQQ